MTLDSIVDAFQARRPPNSRTDVVPASLEHDLVVGPEELATLRYRLLGLPFADARPRRPDDHRAWVGFDGDRWVKVDAKLSAGTPRWPLLTAVCRAVTRPRGPVVVLTGPDGAGKSTLIGTLRGSIPAQVRVHYLGRGGDKPRPRDASDSGSPIGSATVAARRPGLLRECLFVLRWAAKDWTRLAHVMVDARLGAVVLCDRHPIEATARRRREHGVAHLLEQVLTPRGRGVDLFVLLAGDPESLHRRKPEHDPETLAVMTESLRSVLPATAAEIDATESAETVARRAAGLVAETWRRRTVPHVASHPAMAESSARPCLVVSASGVEGIAALQVGVQRRRVARAVHRASHHSDGIARSIGLRHDDRARLAASRLVPVPTAFSVRVGEPTPLECAIEASGITDVEPVRLGAGAGLATRGRAGRRSVVLRVGLTGSAADPTHHALGLEWARSNRVTAPELLDSGEVVGHRWSLEQFVVGNEPGHGASSAAVEAWIRRTIECGRSDETSTLLARQYAELTGRFPRFRSRLATVNDRLREPLARLGSAPAHGDLWTANLLVDDGAVIALDWDAWTDAGVVGLDVGHHHFESLRRTGEFSGLSIGRLLRHRPWDDDEFLATASRVIGQPTDRHDGEAIAFSVWLNGVVNTLRRTPELRWSRSWTTDNIEGGIVAFENI